MTHSFPTRRTADLPAPLGFTNRHKPPAIRMPARLCVLHLQCCKCHWFESLLGNFRSQFPHFQARNDPTIIPTLYAKFRQIRATDREHHARSEEHTSELQSLMRISYAVFCLNKKTTQQKITKLNYT